MHEPSGRRDTEQAAARHPAGNVSTLHDARLRSMAVVMKLVTPEHNTASGEDEAEPVEEEEEEEEEEGGHDLKSDRDGDDDDDEEEEEEEEAQPREQEAGGGADTECTGRGDDRENGGGAGSTGDLSRPRIARRSSVESAFSAIARVANGAESEGSENGQGYGSYADQAEAAARKVLFNRARQLCETRAWSANLDWETLIRAEVDRHAIPATQLTVFSGVTEELRDVMASFGEIGVPNDAATDAILNDLLAAKIALPDIFEQVVGGFSVRGLCDARIRDANREQARKRRRVDEQTGIASPPPASSSFSNGGNGTA